MLRDVMQVISRRTTGRTDRGRTTTTGRAWPDGQRTDDDDGADEGTDGRTADDDRDDGTRRDGQTEDGRRRRDGRRDGRTNRGRRRRRNEHTEPTDDIKQISNCGPKGTAHTTVVCAGRFFIKKTFFL